MALFMSCIMSFIITLFNIGVVPDLLEQWLKAWAFAFVVAVPTIFTVAPIARKLASRLVKIDSVSD